MCSWCWGFSPVIDRIVTRFSNLATLRLVLGGLSPGTTKTMDDKARAMILEHWTHVHDATGQPFDHDFFKRKTFTYDTQPACQAVVTARRLEPGRAFDFLAHLHHAFYAENKDVTDPHTLYDSAADFGFERTAFQSEYEDVATYGETRGDFLLARQVGVNGFPALLGGENGNYRQLSAGYLPWERAEPLIAGWCDGDSIQQDNPAF